MRSADVGTMTLQSTQISFSLALFLFIYMFPTCYFTVMMLWLSVSASGCLECFKHLYLFICVVVVLVDGIKIMDLNQNSPALCSFQFHKPWYLSIRLNWMHIIFMQHVYICNCYIDLFVLFDGPAHALQARVFWAVCLKWTWWTRLFVG